MKCWMTFRLRRAWLSRDRDIWGLTACSLSNNSMALPSLSILLIRTAAALENEEESDSRISLVVINCSSFSDLTCIVCHLWSVQKIDCTGVWRGHDESHLPWSLQIKDVIVLWNITVTYRSQNTPGSIPGVKGYGFYPLNYHHCVF